jgi:hypothetical protein
MNIITFSIAIYSMLNSQVIHSPNILIFLINFFVKYLGRLLAYFNLNFLNSIIL